MTTVSFLILVAFCGALPSAFADAPKIPAAMLAQAERTPSPNALDAQDRYRERERERAHREVKERLGDPSPPVTDGRGFESPRTNLKPDVPDERTKSNQNR